MIWAQTAVNPWWVNWIWSGSLIFRAEVRRVCVCVLPTGRSFLIVPDLRHTSWPLRKGCHPSLYLAFPLEVFQVTSFLSFSPQRLMGQDHSTVKGMTKPNSVLCWKQNSSPVFARPLSSRSTIRLFTVDYSGWQSLKLAKILFFGQRLKAFVSSSFLLETSSLLGLSCVSYSNGIDPNQKWPRGLHVYCLSPLQNTRNWVSPRIEWSCWL